MPQAAGQVLERIKTEVWTPIATVVFATGFMLFMWGLVRFLWNIDNESGRDTGKQHMVWGIVGMFIMVSIWGIIAMIDNTFGLGALDQNGAATDVNRASQIRNVNINVSNF
jgi:uncharacterized membrane protein YidH (DUF202 family)